MAQTAQLKMHTINYAKTQDVYAQYKRSGCNEKYRTLHSEEIQKCEAAKAAFDALGGRRIPKVKELSDKYAALLAEKKECYGEYKAARKEMLDYQTAKQNVDRILGIGEPVQKTGIRKKAAECRVFPGNKPLTYLNRFL